jgi:predicted RNA-binding Zn-ribbon protein involved in translation (DUF1610 family)
MEDFLQEHEVNTAMNKCKGCGGEMKYDIESTDLKCERCGTTMDFDEGGAVLRRAMTQEIVNSHEQWKEGAVSRCDNCGAKAVVDRKSLSKCCAFCGSSKIVSIEELPGVKPDSVIPFQITKDTARQRFIKWLKSRFFCKPMSNLTLCTVQVGRSLRTPTHDIKVYLAAARHKHVQSTAAHKPQA